MAIDNSSSNVGKIWLPLNNPICKTEIDVQTLLIPLNRIKSITPPAWKNNPTIENPLIKSEINDPLSQSVQEILEKITDVKEFELPTNSQTGEDGYQAAVMIGVRRRKMKKHKLKKLRKKMKFEWAKVTKKRA